MKQVRWILDSRNFSCLVVTRFLVTFATQMESVAVGWLVYQIKQDPLYLGLIGLAEALPAIALALFAGWIVDRSRPLHIYRRAITCSSLSVMVLWFVSSPYFLSGPATKLALIFGATFLTGVARAFLSPSQFTLLPLTVEREQLGVASAWNTSFFQIAAVSGPALGGLLYAFGGAGTTFLTILVLLLIGIVSSSEIGVGREKQVPAKTAEPLSASLLTGVRFVFANQILLGAMSLDMFGVLFGGANALFPIFARDIFKNGPIGLGILRAAMPVGSFIMGWFLIRVPISRFSGRALLLAFLGYGLCMIGFGFSNSFELSCILLVLTGMCDSVSMVTRQTILQLMTPQKMRGRVASVNAIFIGSSNEIGAFESGVAAKLMGTRPSVIFGGCMTILVMFITWYRAPRLRKLKLSEL